MLYIIKGGIQWRMLPNDYPKWELVYYYFRIWKEADANGISTLDRILRKLVRRIRNEDLRKDKTTMGIIDAQSVQNNFSANW